MANLKDIRKRITSVKNTSQITRAMKMVAAAKLRRAQEAILNARPFAYRIYSILLSLVEKEGITHPLLTTTREEKKIRLVVLAGDRGLCGSFNANILKEALRFIAKKESEGVEVTIECLGKRANDFLKRRREIARFHEGVLAKPSFEQISTIAEELLQDFTNEHLDAVYLLYNEFKSAVQQRITCERLIPISTEVPEGVAGMLRLGEADRFKNYIFEPGKEELLNEIVPRHFKTQLFRAVLESVASEHGARMSAMENATTNALEMIDELTLEYNKARQAAITTELMEIVGGAEAMK